MGTAKTVFSILHFVYKYDQTFCTCLIFLYPLALIKYVLKFQKE